MAKGTKSKKSSVDPSWVDSVVEVLENKDHDEPARLFYTDYALGQQRSPEALQAVLAKTDAVNVSRHWLAVIAGAGTTLEATAIAELAANAKSARSLLAKTMPQIVDMVGDQSLLARAAENLQEGSPFAPFVLDHGRKAAASVGHTELARILDTRNAFVEKHRAILTDLGEGTQEKKVKAAFAKLEQLAGSERSFAVLWILDQGTADHDVRKWARSEAILDATVSPLMAAAALNTSSVYDSEEKALAEKVAAAGEAGVTRLGEILTVAIQRIWLEAIEHIAEICPKAFSAVFEVVMAGMDVKYTRNKLCTEGRTWTHLLPAAYAERFARKLVAIARARDDDDDADFWRSWFYLYNAGGLAPMVEVLGDPESTSKMIDRAYDAIENMPGEAPQLALVDALWNEKRNVRDLVFAFNKACMPKQHRHVLERLEREPSLDAAWIYVGTHVHWAHRPRFVVDTIERVLAWSPAVLDADADKRASIASIGIASALEIHRYGLAKRLLAMLGTAKKCNDPTEAAPASTVLDKPEQKAKLADLAAGKLEAAQQRIRDEIATLRGAGTPREADDIRLGVLAEGTVSTRILMNASTHEVWFFDGDGELHFYDGYDVVEIPAIFRRFQLGQGWSTHMDGAREFFAGWRIDGRSLMKSEEPGKRVEVMRSGNKLLLTSWNTQYLPVWSVLTLEFPSEDEAARVFTAHVARPLPGFVTVDPYYVPGKRNGGTWRREYGNDTQFGYTVGNQTAWGTSRHSLEPVTYETVEDARTAFDLHEAAALAEGLFPRKLELDEDLRPAAERPLLKWIDDRARDDDKSAAWHVGALAAIRKQLAACQLDVSAVHVEIGPPATEAELAAYDASLSDRMPDELRDLWKAVSYASWTLGTASNRLLSPAQVVAQRAAMRAELTARLATIKRQRSEWEPQFLDLLVQNEAGEGVLAFDTRQQENDCYVTSSTKSLKSYWTSGLGWTLAVSFCSDYVDAIKAHFPEVKRLFVGQSVGELGGKKKAPAAKAPAKKTPAKKVPAKKTPAKKVPAKKAAAKKAPAKKKR
ncbi:MAG: hypothetical protein ACKV2T_01385 [Kofleriaceae bacterium]